jgi:hypothetical protein
VCSSDLKPHQRITVSNYHLGYRKESNMAGPTQGIPKGSPPKKKGGKPSKVRGGGSGKGVHLSSDEGTKVKE